MRVWRSRRGIGSAMAVAVVAAVLPASAMAGAFGSADERVRDALDTVVEAETGPPGAAALIQRGDRTDFVRSGVADIRTGRAWHRSDHMRIASVAKAWSGAVALSLVERGFFSLDDTLGELLPGSPPQWSQVTLAQLLQHTSGVPSYTASPAFQDALRADPRRYFTPQEVVGFVAGEPLLFAPGSSYRYSNTDNILVGLIAEQATGQVYGNNLRQLVYRPLGLRQTSLPTDWRMPLRFVHGYDVTTDAPPEDVSQVLSASGVWASGGIISTPADLNRFMRSYVSGGLFGGEARRAQFRFIPGCGEPSGPGVCSVGLAVYRYETDCGTVYGHTGNFPGYTQFAASTKNGRRSVVVSANEQLVDDVNPPVFELLKDAYGTAVCAALSGRG